MVVVFCVFDLGEKFQGKEDNDRLHEFSCGVYVEKFALRSSLLSQDPPPTLDRGLSCYCARQWGGHTWDNGAALATGQAGQVHAFGPGLSDADWSKLRTFLGYSDPGTDEHMVGRAPRVQANLPIMFWGECILTAGYLINHTPSSVLQFKSSYELLYGKPPIYSNLHVFGALCWAHNQKSKLDKFNSRSRRCIFVGYPFGKKGGKLLDLDSCEYFVSRDVVFYEHEFPFASSSPRNEVPLVSPNVVCSSDEEDEDLEGDLGGGVAVSPLPGPAKQAGVSNEPPSLVPPGVVGVSDGSARGESTESRDGNGGDMRIDVEDLGRSKRVKYSFVKLKDYVTHTVQSFRVCSHRTKPRSFKEEMKYPQWREAMKKEIEALEDNGMWSVVQLPEGKKELGTEWVYKGTVRLHVLVYVDDLIIVGNNSEVVSKFKKYLGNCFHMKDFCILKYFLGVKVARSQKRIFLNQQIYAIDIISETGLLGAKPVGFLMEQNQHLAHSTSAPLKDSERYHRLVGQLLYLSFTRPDLSFAIHVLSQFMHEPRLDRWTAALLVETVSRSSVEAEYRSMAIITYELNYLKGLLRCFGVFHAGSIELLCDSQSVMYLAQNPVFHERTKHIKIGCHFQRDAVLDGTIRLTHVSTRNRLADIFTKAFGKR
ncbi:transmembrane signal receptor [Lithospermum erythrorhizon]|uniref:Transmembrane signal receptor n=1 Tax=Lithospermum erythrorhizon TaxID=34254 RepID=A0AAV3R591_LITER